MTEQDELELLELKELEYQWRELARNDLNEYVQQIEIPGAPLYPDDKDCEQFYPITVIPAKHHRIINDKMMEVERGEARRVMLFMPPGSAKSTYGSITFPTWYMGRNPNKNIISTSYGTDLAKKFGRKCRQVCGSKQFLEIFGCCLNSENRAALDWSIGNSSTYMGAGLQGGITGNRADGLIIDDPIKGRADAESPTIREKCWDAYLNDARTRLKPNGFIVIVQTRWHEDDLSGRILPENWDGESGKVIAKDGEEWDVICLAAQCEKENDPLDRKVGEWLWIDWFSVEHWQQEKKTQGQRNWDALFQQKPKPAEGALIKKKWFKSYSTKPVSFLRIVFSLDTAYKEKEINDPSVLQIWGETKDGYYLLYSWRDKVQYPDLRRIIAEYCQEWQPDAVLIEDKASGQSLIQELRAGVKLVGIDKLIRPPVIAIEPEGNKIDRLIAVSPVMESGLVYLPTSAPWLSDLMSELLGFPIGTHDDQVDSMSQFLKWAFSFSKAIASSRAGVDRVGNVSDAASKSNVDTKAGRVRSRNRFGGY